MRNININPYITVSVLVFYQKLGIQTTTTNCIVLRTIKMLTQSYLIRKSHTETMLFRQYSEFPPNSEACLHTNTDVSNRYW